MADAPDYNAMSRDELTKLRAEVGRAIAGAGERERRAA